MKKIIFIFLILFMSVCVVKADDTFYLGSQIPGQYIEVLDSGRYHNGAPFILTRSDGAFVYCINPFETMSTTVTYKSYSYNDSIFNLTNEKLNELNVISYYGYGYEGHSDIKWYGVTQFLIWEALGYEQVYFTDVYHGVKAEKFMNELNEVRNLVNKHYTQPSFSNKSYEYDPNTNYEIIDTNNILSNYQIIESNIDASINNNKLIINTKNSGNYTIKFARKNTISRNYILYNYTGAQSLLYPGKIDNITFSITISVNSGSITINRFDSQNKSRVEATLDGAIYGIYKDNVLINQLCVNNGVASIKNLALGSYVIKELTQSLGYKRDNNIYDVVISKSNKDVIINLYSDVIEGNLIINKYFGSNDDYEFDDSAVFEVYHNNKLFKTLSGKINEKMEYGNYLIKQISGKKYYDLIGDFSSAILEEKNYEYNFYTDKTDEIKAYEELLGKREEALNQKEKQLIDFENSILEEKNNLIDLKNEINQKQEELNNKKEELDLKEQELDVLQNNLIKEKENMEILKQEITDDYNLLNDKKNELEEENVKLNDLKEQLELLKNELDIDKQELSQLQDIIKNKELELEKLNKELILFNEELKNKEDNLRILQTNLNNKEEELNKTREELSLLNNQLKQKEQELIKLENDVLVVEVPNTYKESNNKKLSIIFIFIGSIFIIYGLIKKVTNHC